MTSGHARRSPVEYQVVPALDARQGVGGVLLISRSSGQKEGAFEVRRLDDNSSRVIFRSVIRTVGGSSYIEAQAQGVANSCGQ